MFTTLFGCGSSALGEEPGIIRVVPWDLEVVSAKEGMLFPDVKLSDSPAMNRGASQIRSVCGWEATESGLVVAQSQSTLRELPDTIRNPRPLAGFLDVPNQEHHESEEGDQGHELPDRESHPGPPSIVSIESSNRPGRDRGVGKIRRGNAPTLAATNRSGSGIAIASMIVPRLDLASLRFWIACSAFPQRPTPDHPCQR